jgi:hypothetical protein
MSIEAMKQALDFLEWFAGDDHSIRPKHKAPEIAVALRQAIAEAEDAVAAEREACAKVCEAMADKQFRQAAIRIRARGGEK